MCRRKTLNYCEYNGKRYAIGQLIKLDVCTVRTSNVYYRDGACALNIYTCNLNLNFQAGARLKKRNINNTSERYQYWDVSWINL